jgi:MbtH protein
MTTDEFEPEATQEYAVVVNDEEQHSIWAVDRPVPAGWRDTGFHGPKEQCLSHIERVWTDITPRSVRQARQAG